VGFDDGHRQTQLRGADGGHVAPEPAPSATTSYRGIGPFRWRVRCCGSEPIAVHIGLCSSAWPRAPGVRAGPARR
jgi:hypothetical protein